MKLQAVCVALLLGAVPVQAQVAIVPQCAESGEDSDGDGLADLCETALASAFAPLLVVRSGGCNWDEAAQPPRHRGGYFHAVQPVGTGGALPGATVRIAYMPAYFRDCGWSGAKCVVPLVSCAPHDGDSEFIVVEVTRAGSDGWNAARIFLSAHCFARSARSCRWYGVESLSSFEWVGGSPVVWVAEGRHANYADWRACDAGHRGLDTCDRHDARFFFPVDPLRNIGSRMRPATEAGCVRGRDVGHGANAEAQECFWRVDARFRGWQPEGRGVTPYERYLREIAEM